MSGRLPSWHAARATALLFFSLLAPFAGCRVAQPEAALALPAPPRPAPPATPTPDIRIYEVTAYSIEGRTASGTRAKEGVVAADPRILPLGSRVRLLDAGKFSGVYSVEDTGRTIRGHELDLYLRNDAEAKAFGRKRLLVERLEPSP